MGGDALVVDQLQPERLQDVRGAEPVHQGPGCARGGAGRGDPGRHTEVPGDGAGAGALALAFGTCGAPLMGESPPRMSAISASSSAIELAYMIRCGAW